MEQETIAIVLQKHADRHKYNDVSELAIDVQALGGSYIVLSWLDKYCLTRDLYRDNSWK
jgi:hypothetical protein